MNQQQVGDSLTNGSLTFIWGVFLHSESRQMPSLDKPPPLASGRVSRHHISWESWRVVGLVPIDRILSSTHLPRGDFGKYMSLLEFTRTLTAVVRSFCLRCY